MNCLLRNLSNSSIDLRIIRKILHNTWTNGTVDYENLYEINIDSLDDIFILINEFEEISISLSPYKEYVYLITINDLPIVSAK
jgi:hypothetical protein